MGAHLYGFRTSLTLIFLGLGLVFFASCAVSGRPPIGAAVHPPGAEEGQVGLASYYSDTLHGRLTASGERYDREALTAAHPTLPFGTVVRVTNLKNGKSIEVRINDRGPFVAKRVIDLSFRAAHAISMIKRGTVLVQLEVIRPAVKS